ncbi:hypothetical protein RI367_002798 [Sorochytrium milnesiophthora]
MTGLVRVTNPTLCSELFVLTDAVNFFQQPTKRWVKRDVRFDGTLLVCLEEKRHVAQGAQTMDPPTQRRHLLPQFQEPVRGPTNARKQRTQVMPKSKSLLSARGGNVAVSPLISSPLLATPESWIEYWTSSGHYYDASALTQYNVNDVDDDIPSALAYTCPVKYYQFPMWTLSVDNIAQVCVQTNAPPNQQHIKRNRTPLMFTLITTAGRCIALKAKSSEDFAMWLFVLKLALHKAPSTVVAKQETAVAAAPIDIPRPASTEPAMMAQSLPARMSSASHGRLLLDQGPSFTSLVAAESGQQSLLSQSLPKMQPVSVAGLDYRDVPDIHRSFDSGFSTASGQSAQKPAPPVVPPRPASVRMSTSSSSLPTPPQPTKHLINANRDVFSAVPLPRDAFDFLQIDPDAPFRAASATTLPISVRRKLRPLSPIKVPQIRRKENEKVVQIIPGTHSGTGSVVGKVSNWGSQRSTVSIDATPEHPPRVSSRVSQPVPVDARVAPKPEVSMSLPGRVQRKPERTVRFQSVGDMSNTNDNKPVAAITKRRSALSQPPLAASKQSAPEVTQPTPPASPDAEAKDTTPVKRTSSTQSTSSVVPRPNRVSSLHATKTPSTSSLKPRPATIATKSPPTAATHPRRTALSLGAASRTTARQGKDAAPAAADVGNSASLSRTTNNTASLSRPRPVGFIGTGVVGLNAHGSSSSKDRPESLSRRASVMSNASQRTQASATAGAGGRLTPPPAQRRVVHMPSMTKLRPLPTAAPTTTSTSTLARTAAARRHRTTAAATAAAHRTSVHELIKQREQEGSEDEISVVKMWAALGLA